MEQLKGGILITPKEIQMLEGKKHYNNALTIHENIRATLGKKDGKLTVKEYCDYNKFDYDEVVRYLNYYRGYKN